MILRDNITSCSWMFPFALGLASVILVMFCVRKKKIAHHNKPKLMRYVQDGEEQDLSRLNNHEKKSSNGQSTQSHEEQRESHRLSSHSMPNEHRILPEIPKGSDQEKEVPGVNPGEKSSVNTTVSVSDGTHHSNSSPKKTRRLPALPPSGSSIDKCDHEIDATYEDLRDDETVQTSAPAETVGSGDSSLYAKVSEDMTKDDFDLYAQVGSGETAGATEKNVAATQVNQQLKSETTSTHSSSEDNVMDSQTTVTYASVDKMKKTLSLRRSDPACTAFTTPPPPPPPPPIPDRNFDEEEDRESNAENSQAPSQESEILQTEQSSTEPYSNLPQVNLSGDHTEVGPAYDTLSVRESFAHQRLRQMVEEERMNRYANTNHALANGLLGQAADPEQPQVYAQIEEEVPEAVYESVSAPGSADGTVGITGSSLRRNLNSREGGYVTIQNIQNESTVPTVE